jgi:LPXTG-motif cell wall-anchored protein
MTPAEQFVEQFTQLPETMKSINSNLFVIIVLLGIIVFLLSRRS